MLTREIEDPRASLTDYFRATKVVIALPEKGETNLCDEVVGTRAPSFEDFARDLCVSKD